MLLRPDKLLLRWSAERDLTFVRTNRATFVLVNDPTIARRLLTDHEHQLSKGAFFEVARGSIGNGTLLADEPKHTVHQRVIKDAFTSGRIDDYGDDFRDLAARAMEKIRSCGEFDPRTITQEFSLKAALLTMFSEDSADGFLEFQEAFNTEVSGLTAQRLLLQVLRRTQPNAGGARKNGPLASTTDLVLKTLSGLSHRVAPRTRSDDMRRYARNLLTIATQRSSRGGGGTNLATMLEAAAIAAPDAWPMDARIDEALTILLAGHETTANTLSWALFESARAGMTPIEEERIDGIILEALRLHPPAWVLPRCAAEDITLDEVTIPEGSNVLISPYAYHHQAEHFPEPLNFDPSRWADMNLREAPDAFMPFGAGGRGCIGQRFAMTEMRAFLTAFAGTGAWRLKDVMPQEQFLLTMRPEGKAALTRP